MIVLLGVLVVFSGPLDSRDRCKRPSLSFLLVSFFWGIDIFADQFRSDENLEDHPRRNHSLNPAGPGGYSTHHRQQDQDSPDATPSVFPVKAIPRAGVHTANWQATLPVRPRNRSQNNSPQDIVRPLENLPERPNMNVPSARSMFGENQMPLYSPYCIRNRHSVT